MGKKVYLFELDSARNSDYEIEMAQKAMFDEIIRNGNTVVMSFNQISDSKGFLCVLENPKTANQITELFRQGHIKISSYMVNGEEMRTASQYFQAKIVQDKFHFSSLEDYEFSKDEKQVIFTALKNCDLGLLNEQGNDDKWKYVYRLLKMIIQISQYEEARNPAKTELGEPMCAFLKEVLGQNDGGQIRFVAELERINPSYAEIKKLTENISSSLAEIQFETLIADDNAKNIRTEWYEAIDQLVDEKKIILKRIIDLCYNYAVEDSISGISKHYEKIGDQTFWNDFVTRYLQVGEKRKMTFVERIQGEENTKTDKKALLKKKYWDTASRIAEDNTRIGFGQKTDEKSLLYESNIEIERKTQRNYLRKRLLGIFCKTFFTILLFAVVNIGIGMLQEKFDFEANTYWGMILGMIISTIIFSILGSIISLKMKLPDILDSVKNIVFTLIDRVRTSFGEKNTSYFCKMNKRK